MSYALDVNVLLYATDRQSSLHKQARAVIDQCAQSSELLCLASLSIMSYLRMATHPRIFKAPLSPDEAMRNMESLTRLPQVRLITEQDGFLAEYRDLMNAFPIRGNLVPDAHLAIVLRQNGVRTLWTHDRDFRKFDFLNVVDPFES
jgi:toxin-antitoxin system PIN domain toxin